MKITLSFVVATLIPTIVSYRDRIHPPLVVDYHEHYYYANLRGKMVESLSINNCSLGGAILDGLIHGGHEADLNVKILKPPKKVIEKWGTKSYYKSQTRIFAHVTENLCTSKVYRNIIKGVYKRAKGCYKVFVTEKNGMRKKRYNDYGATLHPEHVRCENEQTMPICESGHNGLQVVDRRFRDLHNFPFLITAKNVVVTKGGMLALPCGPFGLFSSCEAVKWGVPFANASVQYVETCRNDEKSCPYPVYDRVFSMTQYDDTQIGQFMQEALPKLIFHLEFLKKNPDIMIHFGFTKQPKLPPFVLPHFYFRWLGLENRLINGTYYAKEVFMPREGGCQDIGYNAWEAVSMREKFLEMNGINEDKNFVTINDNTKRSILVLTRSPGAYTQNKADIKRRSWPKKQFPQFLTALQQNFPDHEIRLFSDSNSTLMQCPLCQAREFYYADVVIGMHGAGLSNAIYMKPGGVLVEVIYNFDSRHAPVIGIFPRLSGIVGLHHFSYYFRDTGLDMVHLVDEIVDFNKKARLWA